jgi:hypothetical protein
MANEIKLSRGSRQRKWELCGTLATLDIQKNNAV